MKKNLLKILLLSLAFSNLYAAEEYPEKKVTLSELEKMPDEVKTLSVNLVLGKFIPEEVEGLANILPKFINLQDLNINFGSCGVDDKEKTALLEGLPNLINLKKLKLRLDCNGFYCKEITTLFEGLSKLHCFEELIIDLDNSICDENFFAGLSKLTNIKNLYFPLYKDIDNKVIIKFFEILPNLINLKHLDLYLDDKKIDCNLLKELKHELPLENIETLKIYLGNINTYPIRILGLCKLLLKFPNTKKLRLDLTNSNLDSKGARVLFKGLPNLINLKRLDLDLSDNKLDSEGIRVLVEGLPKLTNLKHLNLSLRRNGLGSEGAGVLFKGLPNLINLKHLDLDLSDNKLDSKGANAIIFYLQEKKSGTLMSISLYNNNISNEKIKVVDELLSLHKEYYETFIFRTMLIKAFKKQNKDYRKEIIWDLWNMKLFDTMLKKEIVFKMIGEHPVTYELIPLVDCLMI